MRAAQASRVSGAFDLPCLWAPLQSVTAATSRYPFRAFVASVGAASSAFGRAWRSTAIPVPCARPPGGCVGSPTSSWGEPQWFGGAGWLEVSGRHEWRPSAASFTASEPKNRMRCVLGVARPTEVGLAASKSPCRSVSAEAGAAGAGGLRFPGLRAASPKRGGCAPFRRRSPPIVVVPKRGVDARHAAGIVTTPPMGFGPLRRLNPGDRCVGLPLRHHPFSGFLTLSTV
jgi:hypothetical protein